MVAKQPGNKLKPRDILTTGDIARYCHVHFRTVIRWIEKGRLNAYKLPGRGDNRVKVEDFITFLKDNNLPIPEEFCSTDKRVLIIDDEPAMAAAIQRILKRAGYQTQIAQDGFQAGTLITSFNPSLITLDLSMPGMDGFAVLKYIRENESLKNIKIIVISALDDSKLKQAKSEGADLCISKPFEKADLLKSIASLTGDSYIEK